MNYTFYCYIPKFILPKTIGHEIDGIKTNWICVDLLNEPAPRYLMKKVRKDGYIETPNKRFFQIEQLSSVKFVVIDTKEVSTTKKFSKIEWEEDELEELIND